MLTVLIIIILLVLLAAYILLRIFMFKSKRYGVEKEECPKIDLDRAVKNLSEAVKLKTISYFDKAKIDWGEFERFIKFLEEAYPLVHSKMERERINKYSLLYKWKGRDKDKKPVLFMGHIDVVPVEEGSEGNWAHPPFSGAVEDGFVWGRGTLDIKIQIITLLEAAEHLLEEGYEPGRDIYFAFGHDEELGGLDGAVNIVDVLKSRGVTFEYVLDEGGCVTEGAISGVSSPLAAIGIAEKGFVNISLTCEGKGGHSSMPPRNTSVGLISRAIVELEKHQCKVRMSRCFKDMLNCIGPEMNFLNRMVIANLWLFSPIIKKVFTSFPAGNAMLRTTTAATMTEGSPAPNVLPQKARAVVNFRIIPGETGEYLLEHVRKVIKNDDILVEPLILENPSNISDTESFGYKSIEKAVYSIFPEAVAAPYIVLGGTDARKYEVLCGNVFRFSPYRIVSEDLSKMHGTNERISLENIDKCVAFYIKLFKTEP